MWTGKIQQYLSSCKYIQHTAAKSVYNRHFTVITLSLNPYRNLPLLMVDMIEIVEKNTPNKHCVFSLHMLSLYDCTRFRTVPLRWQCINFQPKTTNQKQYILQSAHYIHDL